MSINDNEINDLNISQPNEYINMIQLSKCMSHLYEFMGKKTHWRKKNIFSNHHQNFFPKFQNTFTSYPSGLYQASWPYDPNVWSNCI